jgi:hypothetical protein
VTSDDLTSYIVRILLRYFRKGDPQIVDGAEVQQSDRELLLLQWAASEQVADLCRYLIQHPHELRAVLQPRIAVSSSSIRGRIRAAESVALQERTGEPGVFVYDEPFRSFDAGPNKVLGWTLMYATQVARRFRSALPTEATYRNRITDQLRRLEDVRRALPPISGPISLPSAGDVRASRTSRQLLYRKAAAAYDFLCAVEHLEEIAVKDLLMRSLVGPMERWRQFELALALSMANAVAARIHTEISLRSILPGTGDSIIDVGPYAIRWQRSGPGFAPLRFAEWEAREMEIIREYGLSPGYDRPDIVMYDRRTNGVVSVGEAKYFDNDDWRDRLRDAVSQIVTYARGYENEQNVDQILGRSIIALWSAGDRTPEPLTTLSPWVTTFSEMGAGLATWAVRAVPAASTEA